MANIPIRDIPLEGTPTGSAYVVYDDGQMKKGKVESLADAVRPVASQGEAEAGVNNTKVMPPVRVKQAIAAEVGVTLASKAQGDLANTALQPAAIGAYGPYGTTYSSSDLNSIQVNGRYSGTGMINAPDTGWWVVDHMVQGNSPTTHATQVAYQITTGTTHVRSFATTWGAWAPAGLPALSGVATKSPLVSADKLLISDSADGGALKRAAFPDVFNPAFIPALNRDWVDFTGDFGAQQGGSVVGSFAGFPDCRTAWENAVTFCRNNRGVYLRIPRGTFFIKSKPDVLDFDIRIKGWSRRNSALVRAYAPSGGEAFIALGPNAADAALSDFMVIAGDSTTGGTAIQAYASALASPNDIVLERLDVTPGAGLWGGYAVNLDGQFMVGSALGIRAATIRDCLFFGATEHSLRICSCNNTIIEGVGVFPAGGTFGSITVGGVPGNLSNDFRISTSFCGGFLFDLAKGGTVSSSVTGNVLFTGNAQNIVGVGPVSGSITDAGTNCNWITGA